MHKKITILAATVWVLLGNVVSAAPLKQLKLGEVVPLSACQADARNCICEVGTLPRSFRAYNGVNYLECTPSRCPPGQIVRESRTAGGKLNVECVAQKAPTYSEPKVRSIVPRAR